MSTQHTQLTKQLKAVFGGGTKRGNAFVNIIQSRRIIHLQTKMMFVVTVVQRSNAFYLVFIIKSILMNMHTHITPP